MVCLIRDASLTLHLGLVQESGHVVRFTAHCQCQTDCADSVDALVRFRLQTQDRPEKATLFGKLLQWLLMETNADTCWQDAVDSEEAIFDLLKLVEHGHHDFFL